MNGSLLLHLTIRALLLGACLMASSCAVTPTAGRGGLEPAPAQVVERLEERRKNVRAFTMSGEITIKTPQGELSGDHFIQGAWPDRLRADVTGPFGRRVLSLVTDGEQLVVIDFSGGRAYTGRATRANVARFLGISFSASEVYTLLAGSVPLLKPATLKLTAAAGQGVMVLRLLHNGGSLVQGVRLLMGDWRIFEAWVDEVGDGNRLTIDYDRFQEAAFSAYPKFIRVKDGEGRLLLLENQKLAINPKDAAPRFEITIPAGLKRVRLD